MKKTFTKSILGILAVASFPAFAQQYQTTIDVTGDDYANKILIDGDNITMVGSTNATGAGGYDLLLLFGQLDGSFANTGQAGGGRNETARAIAKFSSGYTYIAGASNSFSSAPNADDLFVIGLQPTGDPAWLKVLGTDSLDRSFAITEGNDGNVIVAGQTKQGGANARFNGIITKLDATTGDVIWSKSVGTEYTNEVIYSIQAIGGDGYLLLGYTGVNVIGLNEALVVLLDEDGNKTAAFIFGGPGDDDARQYVNTASGKFFVAGNTRNVGQGAGEVFLARFDVSGQFPTLDWFKTYGGTGNESFSSASVNSSNDGVILVGSTASFGTGGDAFAISVDAEGVVQWSKNYGGSGSDIFQNIAEDGSGGYIAAGYSNSFGGTQNDVWVVRMDSLGNSPCNSFDAAFVEETIDNTVAYADFTDLSLDDILSTDSVLTVRDISAIAINENTLTTTTLCVTVGISDNAASSFAQIFPNPAGESLNFIFEAISSKEVVIYNSVGAIVFQAKPGVSELNYTADLSELTNGMYAVMVSSNGQQSFSKLTVSK